MVFRADTIQVRLQRLEEIISELEVLAGVDPAALRSSLREMWAVERGLHLGAEVLFDIGNHILSSRYGVSSESYGDILAQLAQRGILGEDLPSRLRGLSGFRNILVHDYLRLDPDRVLEALSKAPRDFSDFAHAIRQWLEMEGGQDAEP